MLPQSAHQGLSDCAGLLQESGSFGAAEALWAAELEVAPNGVHGSLHGLLHGDNELELQVYGEGYWPPDLLLEESHTYHVHFRPPLDMDRG